MVMQMDAMRFRKYSWFSNRQVIWVNELKFKKYSWLLKNEYKLIKKLFWFLNHQMANDMYAKKYSWLLRNEGIKKYSWSLNQQMIEWNVFELRNTIAFLIMRMLRSILDFLKMSANDLRNTFNLLIIWM